MQQSTIIIFCFLISIVICYQIYFEKVVAKRIPIKRKQKILELLKSKYTGLKENNLGYLEHTINNEKILFEFISNRSVNNSFSNNLYIYLDITTIEEDIKKLCKIHFYCSTIDNRDWIKIRVNPFYESLNNLVKHSDETVHKLISDAEFYISQKRAERK